MALDRQYTPQQVAEILGVTDDGILKMIHSGELAASDVARTTSSKRPRWRIAESLLWSHLLWRHLDQST